MKNHRWPRLPKHRNIYRDFTKKRHPREAGNVENSNITWKYKKETNVGKGGWILTETNLPRLFIVKTVLNGKSQVMLPHRGDDALPDDHEVRIRRKIM
ncbi:hypothetical protein LTR70_000114 [Exophiala xenobiotica]|uniref:Uncharacterized protein n=1 Tax=Lithohypha guttulata TaxID=1690604 RepID=A0ABR0KP49_9EURO|nr:hypothetical protein LTR24_000239 [Lithohypha guttulata]KAK5330792.1 hypothetical protein LTR70_000114 [Exophiala xenobiotica]